MTTFDRYDHLPEPIRKAFAELEDFIGDLDGKTMGTEASDGEGFIDEGTVDADDAVKAFNVLVAALPAQEWQDISTAPTGDDDFYLVCCDDPADDRSPFVVRGSIFASARKHPVTSHLSLAHLTHWMPLPAKPVAVIADKGTK